VSSVSSALSADRRLIAVAVLCSIVSAARLVRTAVPGD
jgi:hypothetical protein